MYRLHEGLRDIGVTSRLLCATKTTHDSDVYTIKPHNRLNRKLERSIGAVTGSLGLNDINLISKSKIARHWAYAEADIINIHGTHNGFINYLTLPALSRRKPSVFILHDMWAMTGHCAVTYDCYRWVGGCGRCPYPDAPPRIKKDNTRIEWMLKNWVYKRSHLTIVAPSQYMFEQARRSMLSRFPIVKISHGIDTRVYRPMDQAECRRRLGIRTDKKVLMTVAVSLNLYSKGGDLLVTALQSLPEEVKARVMLLTIGKPSHALSNTTGIETMDLGFIDDDAGKVAAYNAADVFISPTRGESFGLTIQESMACATPVVSFNVGGVTDLVEHAKTGYLAVPENAHDLSYNVHSLLWHDDARIAMGERCRDLIVKEFRIEHQAQNYCDLYTALTN